jgi:acetylornithine deacetylase/succinyl-diaminopimelate desuccinylase-like protein
MVLAQILAQMKDRGGRIKIPGFYDDVRTLSDEERAAWEKLPFNDKKYRKDLGAPKLFGESGFSTLERVWARPTFEVNGLLSGFTGEGAKTVIPAVAMAKVSMRLVPDQHPDKIAPLFEAYVKKVRAENRRRQTHPDARRQAVDHRVRQPLRARPPAAPSKPASDEHRCSAVKADRSRSSRRSRKNSACRRCSSASGYPMKTRTPRTSGSTSAISTTASSRRRRCTRRSRACVEEGFLDS